MRSWTSWPGTSGWPKPTPCGMSSGRKFSAPIRRISRLGCLFPSRKSSRRLRTLSFRRHSGWGNLVKYFCPMRTLLPRRISLSCSVNAMDRPPKLHPPRHGASGTKKPVSFSMGAMVIRRIRGRLSLSFGRKPSPAMIWPCTHWPSYFWSKVKYRRISVRLCGGCAGAQN